MAANTVPVIPKLAPRHLMGPNCRNFRANPNVRFCCPVHGCQYTHGWPDRFATHFRDDHAAELGRMVQNDMLPARARCRLQYETIFVEELDTTRNAWTRTPAMIYVLRIWGGLALTGPGANGQLIPMMAVQNYLAGTTIPPDVRP